MTINKRIDLIIKYLDIEQGEFADSINEKDSFISRIVNGGTNEPGFNKIAKIYQFYPEINPHWLLTGDGDMLKKEENKMNVGNIHGNDNNHNIVNMSTLGECEERVRGLEKEIQRLEEQVKDKNEIISLLKQSK